MMQVLRAVDKEYKDLARLALDECKKAADEGDVETAGIFLNEAFDCLSKLPEFEEQMKIAQ